MPIVIEGEKNLQLLKRMALSHVCLSASRSLKARTKEEEEFFDREMAEAVKMSEYADAQIKRDKIAEEG